MNNEGLSNEWSDDEFFKILGRNKLRAIVALLIVFIYVIPITAAVQATNILMPLIFGLSFMKPFTGFFYELMTLLVIAGFTYHTLHGYFMSVSERLLQRYKRKMYEKYKNALLEIYGKRNNTKRGKNEMDI
ncbi:hypothetical protein IGB31_14280 [Pseudomonas putida]|nr:hypothetical protein IGB31_14280 [Pseudomonas putida]